MNKLAIKETFKNNCKKLNNELFLALDADELNSTKETLNTIEQIQATLKKLNNDFIKAYYN